MTDTHEETGLEPLQEQAAYMLAMGKGVQQVADELDIHRSTLWEWRQQPSFEAFFNRLLFEIKSEVQQGLVGLYRDAIETIQECLQSEDDRVALKTAFRVIERVDAVPMGPTDVHTIVQSRNTKHVQDPRTGEINEHIDQEAYEEVCAELGIEPKH